MTASAALQHPTCTRLSYKTADEAHQQKRKLELWLRLRCRVVYCERHDEYHVTYGATNSYDLIDAKHQQVLRLLAMGLRDYEIAEEMQITAKQVEHAIARLCRRFNALSRTNLVAIAVFLGIIDVAPFIEKITVMEKEEHAERTADVQ